MAKNSKKAKASRKQGRSAGTAADALETVRAHLERGSSKRALKEAKQAAKAYPGREAEELLLAAYRARISDLAQAGLEEEAGSLIAHVKERFGDAAAGFDSDAERLAFRSDPGELLREWRQTDLPEERRAQIVQRLRSDLIDPGVVAASPELPEDDPLKRAARAVVRAFEEAAAGTLGEDARRGLATVSRRSPLAPWRTLCLSLAAFHAGDDQRVTELLERIPEDSAPAQAARLLRVLMGDVETPRDLPPAAASLVRRVGGGTLELRALATSLRAAHEGDDRRGVEQGVLRLLPRLAAHDERLAQTFCRWIHGGGVDVDTDVLDPAEENAFTSGEAHRLWALDCARHDPQGALEYWGDWLDAQGRKRRGLSAAELPLLAELLGELAWQADRDARQRGASLPLDDWVLDELDSLAGHGLPPRRVGDLLRQLRPHQIDPFYLKLNDVRLARTFTESSGRPVRWTQLATDLLDLALELDPTPERFRHRADRLTKAPPSEREQALRAWAAALPGDPEPWLRMASECAGRSALKKGLQYLGEAERRDPLSAEVRGLRFRLLVGNLLRHLRDGRTRLAEKDVAELESLPAASTPARRLLVLAARVALAGEAAGQGASLAELESQAGSAPRAAAVGAFLDHLVAPPRRRAQVTLEGDDRERLSCAALILKVARDAHHDPWSVLQPHDVPRSPRSEDLPADSEELLLLCAWADRYQAPDLEYVASGRGLLADGPRLAAFSMHRYGGMDSQGLASPARDCHRLAQLLARRSGDTEVLANLHYCPCCAPLLAESLGEEEAREILERERSRQGTLKERVHEEGGVFPKREPPARARRPRRRPAAEYEQPLLPFFEALEEEAHEA